MSTFMIPKDGAFQEPEEVKRKQDGAWVEAEFARRIIDGAWSEVWSAKKVFDLLQNTISTGSASFSAEWESGLSYMTGKNEGGTLVCTIDGDFTNPVLSFLFEGWFYHQTAQKYVNFGHVYAYGVRTDGTVEQTVEIGTGLAESLTQLTHTFTGSYTKVGFKAVVNNYNVTQFDPLCYFNMKSITIDGKKCVFDPADNFNFN